jgi:hypothetical protein
MSFRSRSGICPRVMRQATPCQGIGTAYSARQCAQARARSPDHCTR